MVVIRASAALTRMVLSQQHVHMEGHAEFVHLLRNRRGPLITVSNHTSTVDDPVIFGYLPPDLIQPRRFRWGLGAKEICFKNRLFSWFFDSGQIIPIVRGDGIYQHGMNIALGKLKNGHWIHIFPEAKVHPNSHHVLRFKWGIGRLLMDSEPDSIPTVVPIWTNGVEHILPPSCTIPRLGKHVQVVFGKPLPMPRLLEESRHLNEAERRMYLTFHTQKAVEQLRTQHYKKLQ